MIKGRRTTSKGKGIRGSLLPFFCAFLLLSCGDNFGKAIHAVTGNGDGPVPGNSGIVSASYLSSTLLDVRWQKGTDSVASSNRLQYRVFACPSQTSSIDESLSLGQELTQGWAVDIDEVKSYVSGSPSWCNVYIRNEDGKIASYQSVSPTAYVNVPPAPGGDGLLTLSQSFSDVTVSWTKGTDTETQQSSLVYRAFFSLSENISSFTEASANGTEITSGWTMDLSSVTADDLDYQTSYWFSVFVMDADGRISAYQKTSITTQSDSGPVPGGAVSYVRSLYSVQFGWPAAAGTGTVCYRVFRTDGSSSENTISTYENAVNSGVELTGGWTEGLASVSASSLSAGSTYWAVVFARDAAGSVSSYSPVSVTLPSDAAPSTGGSGAVSVSVSSGKNITVSWTKASDDYTQSELLQYRVYMSTSADDLAGSSIPSESSTVTEVTKGWTDDISSVALTLPLRQTNYYFNVYVCDRTGHSTAYAGSSAFMLGKSDPPVAGGSGVLAVVSSNSSSAKTVSWTKASDDETSSALLHYRVYYSKVESDVSGATLPSTSTVSEATAGWTEDISSAAAVLSSSATYYFNVYVCDEEGQVTAYTHCSLITGLSGPTVGTSLTAVSPISTNNVGLSWGAASGSGTIKYIVYYSTVQADVSSYSAAQTSGTAFGSWQTGTGTTVTGLSKSTTYWFNVFAVDDSGIVVEYGEISQATN